MNSYQAAVGGVLVVLIFGIAVEKHYVSRSTVFYNLLSFILLLASIEISGLLLAGLILYLILGAVIMKLDMKPLFPAFGARAYGSLSLVLLLEGRTFIPGIEGRGMYETFGLLLLLWMIITALIHLVGRWYQKQSWDIF
ncbi:MAG: hypothetical protein ACLFU5_01335 [Thermoplasmata archaeon]